MAHRPTDAERCPRRVAFVVDGTPRTEARLTPHPAPVDAERDGGQLPPAGVIA